MNPIEQMMTTIMNMLLIASIFIVIAVIGFFLLNEYENKCNRERGE